MSDTPLTLRFYGTRGSCPAPYEDRLAFGGNTACASLRCGDTWVVLDAGTGIIALGDDIRRAVHISGRDAGEFSVLILLSHLHLDHITGLPMFLPRLPKGIRVTIGCACPDFENSLNELFRPPYWPVTLRYLCPQLRFVQLDADTPAQPEDGITVLPVPSNHPDGTHLYRVGLRGRTVCWGLDCELTPACRARYLAFARDCDVLLFDGTYTPQDYPRCRGFGHSPYTLADDLRRDGNVGRVFVLHYEYDYTDDLLRAEQENLPDGVSFAREGDEIAL